MTRAQTGWTLRREPFIGIAALSCADVIPLLLLGVEAAKAMALDGEAERILRG